MMMNVQNQKQQDQYRLDPAIAASLRLPVRTNLTPDEKKELARIDAYIAKFRTGKKKS